VKVSKQLILQNLFTKEQKLLKNFTDNRSIINNSYRRCRFKDFKLKVLANLYEDSFVELCCRLTEKKNNMGTKVPSSTFAKVHRFKFKNKIYYHKSFLPRNKWEQIKNFFKKTRAERTMKGHLLLEKNGFDTPRIAAVGQKGSSNFIVSETMNNEKNGLSYWQESFPAEEDYFMNKRALIRSLGRTIGKLHALFIFHGDLRLNNMGINSSEPGKWQFEFIDNERTVQLRRLSDARRIRNLTQLCMSANHLTTRTDRLCFFNAYLSENPQLLIQKKQWIKRILTYFSKRLREKALKKAGNTVQKYL